MPLPVIRPSCCAFGGPDGTTLYITSATYGPRRAGRRAAAGRHPQQRRANVSIPVRLSLAGGRRRRPGEENDEGGVIPPKVVLVVFSHRR
ncbi:MAG: SMP-30/gluconolactonase/LRE family protein [Sodalis sp. (in: enterobacteria)]|uniref:SMP-30/gluconolactonase/LRE family protein n=1 Tax=Sodalis sp. (in: enterobacteria) TaxID=1898979 RepID=UPI003F2B920D